MICNTALAYDVTIAEGDAHPSAIESKEALFNDDMTSKRPF